MKMYEKLYSGDDILMPLIPALARLDGKTFHTFTRGLQRPFDPRLTELMRITTAFLVESTNAVVGYTQSDEISLVWSSDDYKTERMFGGRVQKLASVLAATASVFFNRNLHLLPEKKDELPVFDCRVWSVPNQEEAINYLIWRQQDCTRNSISMAAQSKFSHKALMNKSCDEMQEMLFQKGINWSEYPEAFKNGRFFIRKRIFRPLTVRELDLLPEKHYARLDPTAVYSRLITEESSVILTKIENRVEYIFG